MKVLGIIPARYGSARFEGKPLADIYGKPMIQRVYEQAIKAIDIVYVATDHTQIYDVVKSFGGNVVMTNADHETGTNRCLEASNKIQESFSHDVVINIQGDEPLLDPDNLKALIQIFVSDHSVDFGTLIKSVDPNKDKLEAGDGVYVTKKENDEAILFSRSIIPFVRDWSKENWTAKHTFFKHIGVYAYTV
ncbi:MAG: 3-deoxy-manno-octulosonate cytidylyltransferase, partial [Crocinitomicaceae bacterium]|nr:3-deoxy-manno-octulosonate cytidylyltransferase [Crocinitomicaceae bacterium]